MTVEIRGFSFKMGLAEGDSLVVAVDCSAGGALAMAPGVVPAGENVDLSHVMKEHQERMRQEYEGKLADLERERESIEEEKAQVCM